MRGASFPMPTIKYATGPFCHLDSPVAVESGKMTNSQHYCLRWNNHIANFVQVVAQLLKSETFADCTIAVDDGTTIKCHKVVLAACSTYFNELFTKNPCEHPMVILSDVKYSEIRAILDYMYRGEVNVLEDELSSLMKIASFLKVKGLIDEGGNGERREVNGRLQVPEPERNDEPLTMLTAAAAAAQAAAVAASSVVNCNGSPLTNGYASPPPHVAAPFSVPFGKATLDPHNPMSLWPALAGLHQLPQHPISGHQPTPRSPFLAGSYDAISDTSPLSRKKRSSYMANRDTPILRNVLGGQNDSAPNDRPEIYSNNNSNGSMHEAERRNSSEHSEPMAEDDEKPTTPNKYGSQKEPKPEWKRYKQYTRQHIADAMAAVKNKEMSALQAASKYGIPSRTLYDKLKKAGILPTRGAGIQRASRSDPSAAAASAALCAGSARFPYSGSMNGNVYGGVAANGVSESESETNGYDAPASLVVAPSNVHASRNEDMEVQPTTNNGQSGNEDGAEDLSLGSRRSSDHSVIVPPAVKEEADEASTQHDES